MMRDHEERAGKAEPPTDEGRQVLEGLRTIWTVNGQMGAALSGDGLGLECADDERGCSVNVNFDAFAENVEPTSETTEAIDRLRRAWKATLAKEGKLFDPEAEVGPGG
jgi:hypothetical protein